MVVELVRVRRCDVCNAVEGVQRYRLTRLDGEVRTTTVDLCTDHGSVIEAAMDASPRPRRSKRAVVPMKEITARKRAAKKS